jgi:hypothetical protein
MGPGGGRGEAYRIEEATPYQFVHDLLADRQFVELSALIANFAGFERCQSVALSQQMIWQNDDDDDGDGQNMPKEGCSISSPDRSNPSPCLILSPSLY